jgi:hypothetical protein
MQIADNFFQGKQDRCQRRVERRCDRRRSADRNQRFHFFRAQPQLAAKKRC